MSQVQHALHAAAIEAKPSIERGPHASTHSFQTSIDPWSFFNTPDPPHIVFAPQTVLANGLSLHGLPESGLLLEDSTLASPFPHLETGRCQPHATDELAHRYYQTGPLSCDLANSPTASSTISSCPSLSYHPDIHRTLSEPLQHSSQAIPTPPSLAFVIPSASGPEMTSVAMVDKRFPTTPKSLDDEYRGIHHLVQHNAATPYDSSLDDHADFALHGSPASNHWLPEHYYDRHDMYQPRNDGLGAQYVSNPPVWRESRKSLTFDKDWHAGADMRYNNPYPGSYPQQRFGPGYPPTPAMSDRSSGDSHFGRGETVPPRSRASVEPKQRASPAPRAKKPKAKSDKNEGPELTAPLSVLTKDMSIPIRDMEAWVNRGPEQRRQEVAKKNGRISRPMNSFMLYRAAFQERTKKWCLQNNHQVVSSVSGKSWFLELPEIRDEYAEWSKTERANHQKAHPGYKFSPSKAKGTPRKRKGDEFDSDEEGTELDGSDYDWTPSGARRVRSRQRPKTLGRDGEYHEPNHYLNDMSYAYPHGMPVMNRSAFQSSNPGRPLPAAMTALNAYGEQGLYYSQSMRPNIQGPNQVEDIRIHKTQIPNSHLGAPSGLPGANHDDLIGGFDQHSMGSLYSPSSQYVDPNLMGFDEGYGGGGGGGVFTEEGFHELNGDILAEQHGQPLQESKPAPEAESAPWDKPSAEDDQAFKDWLTQNNGR